MREIQYVEAKANGPFEVSTLTIDNVDSGDFKMVFFHQNGTPTATGKIPVKASAATLKSKIETWFSKNLGTGVTVERWIYSANGTDLNGNETAQDPVTNATLWTKSVYNITLNEYISSKSTSNMMATVSGSSATVAA